jgi:class 3 adenylate cyclase
MSRVNVESRYARTIDGMHVAYQVTGAGDVDIVLLRAWVGDIEHEWQEPVLARMLRRLGSMGRLIRLDRRGMGQSDRMIYRPPATIEERLDDIRAVLDAVGSKRAVLIGLADGSSLASLFAAMHPDRTLGLVLYEPVARSSNPDSPWAPNAEQFAASIAAIRAGWGTRDLAARWVASGGPSRTDDEHLIEWFAEQQRRAGSREDAVALVELQRDTDISVALPAIHVPTLVLTRQGQEDNAAVRAVADQIPGARLLTLAGVDQFVIAGDTDAVLREIEEFVAQLARSPAETDTDRVLATVLFTDIVGSTARATELGDRAWSELMGRHHGNLRRIVAAHRGRVVDTSGDGMFASFDGPGRAIRCSMEVVRDANELGLGLRAGLHTGECEVAGDNLRGIAVHIGARVASLADRSEILVTQTVKDLVSGGGFQFGDRGSHQLKGVPGEWRLYVVAGGSAPA